MNDEVKAKHKIIDLELLSVQMWGITKKLHESSLILGHHMTTLSQGVQFITVALNEFLGKMPLPKPFLK
jgi:hypothetical protein